jgi:hypothetical protein
MLLTPDAESLLQNQTFRTSQKMRYKKIIQRTFLPVPVVFLLRRHAVCGPHKTRIQIMQRVTMVRYTTKREHSAENEALSRAVFAQLRSDPPEGVAYALFRDGNEFIHVFVNLKVDESAAVTELPAFKAFESGVKERCDVPPNPLRVAAQLVDCYGFGAGSLS